MTIVIDRHPVLAAVVASAVVTMFVAGWAWLTAHSLRDLRSNKKSAGVRSGVVGVAGIVCGLMFGAWWWRNWSPWAVELSDSAIELKYLLSTQRIELADLEHVEFKLERPGRRRERSVLRLSSGGRVHNVTQDRESPGDLATRPVGRCSINWRSGWRRTKFAICAVNDAIPVNHAWRLGRCDREYSLNDAQGLELTLRSHM